MNKTNYFLAKRKQTGGKNVCIKKRDTYMPKKENLLKRIPCNNLRKKNK